MLMAARVSPGLSLNKRNPKKAFREDACIASLPFACSETASKKNLGAHGHYFKTV